MAHSPKLHLLFIYAYFLVDEQKKRDPETRVDPAMYIILVVMVVMFITICVVLRLFSRLVINVKYYFNIMKSFEWVYLYIVIFYIISCQK